MKKTVLLFVAALIFVNLISCDIKADSPFAGTLNITVTGLPALTGDAEDDKTALMLFCNLNDWDVDKVNGSDEYIAKLSDDGTATFVLSNYSFANPLKCQFVLVADETVQLASATWWNNALSGGSYSESEDNFVYVFNKAEDGMTLTLNAVPYNGSARIHLGLNPFSSSVQ